MNRNSLLLALAALLAVVALASFGCTPTESGTNLTTNRNSTVETPNYASIESELQKMETDWSAAYKNKDAAAVRRILADDVVTTAPDGSMSTKNDEIQLAETGAFTFDSWEIADTKVTVLDADAAFMTGRTTIKNGKLKEPKSQKMIDISGEYRFLDVFAKRNGKWQVVASQATQIQTPPPAPAPKAAK